MYEDQISTAIIFPEVLDWFTDERVSRFKAEVSQCLSTLEWSGLLRKIALNWVRLEIISEQKVSLLPSSYNEEADKILMSWSRDRWESVLESKYLENKHLLDKVTYSLIRVSDQNLAFEIYHRIKAKEASFEQLSWQYGEGNEKQRAGLIVNQRIGESPQAFHPLFRKLYPGEILKPHKLGKLYVVLSLHHFNAAQLDEETQALLLRKELDQWLSSAVDYLCDRLKLKD